MRKRMHIDLRRTFSGRGLISILGLAIGVAAVFCLQTLTEAVRRETIPHLVAGTEDVVSAEFTQRAASSETREAPPASSQILPQLEPRLPGGTILASFGETRESVHYSGKTYDVRVAGVSPSFFDLFAIPIRHGRTLSPLDRNRPVAVLGRKQAVAWAGAGDPATLVGRQFELNETVFTIVGIIDGIETDLGKRLAQENAIVLNAEVFERRLSNAGMSFVLVGLESPDDREHVGDALRTYFDSRLGTSGIKISSLSEARLRLAAEFRLITLVLTVVGGVAFTLGSLGIVGLLMGNLASRNSEIGLRRALGAPARGIRNWFLLEALLICAAGTLGGLIVGGILTIVFAANKSWEASWSVPGALAASAMALLVGTVSGAIIGANAAKIQPGDAMRHSA